MTTVAETQPSPLTENELAAIEEGLKRFPKGELVQWEDHPAVYLASPVAVATGALMNDRSSIAGFICKVLEINPAELEAIYDKYGRPNKSVYDGNEDAEFLALDMAAFFTAAPMNTWKLLQLVGQLRDALRQADTDFGLAIDSLRIAKENDGGVDDEEIGLALSGQKAVQAAAALWEGH